MLRRHLQVMPLLSGRQQADLLERIEETLRCTTYCLARKDGTASFGLAVRRAGPLSATVIHRIWGSESLESALPPWAAAEQIANTRQSAFATNMQ